ncbi:MAG: thioredoxin family protein [Bacteroidota bacterium]
MKLFILLLFSSALSSLLNAQDSTATAKPIFGVYAPSADPEEQLKQAISDATKDNKRILLDVGGEWCKWCHYLDRFFEENANVTAFLKEHYVLVKINFSKENLNESFLSKFPKVPGYPHFFVLDNDGSFLYSQDTGKLEKGQGHDHDKVLSFLKQWSKGNALRK